MADDWKTPWSVREPHLAILHLVDAAGDRVLPAVMVGELRGAEREVLEKIAESVNEIGRLRAALDAMTESRDALRRDRDEWESRARVLLAELEDGQVVSGEAFDVIKAIVGEEF